jgi:hypothetical protein
MTPEERAEQIVTTEPGMDAIRHADLIQLERLIAATIRAAVLEDREAGVSIIQKYLLFDNQRAVSWHEVQDAIAAIRARNNP